MDWLIYLFTTHRKMLNLHITTINLKYLLPLGSYSIADIQDCFELIIIIYSNKIKNRIVFKVKTGYKVELLSPEAMKLLGSTKR